MVTTLVGCRQPTEPVVIAHIEHVTATEGNQPVTQVATRRNQLKFPQQLSEYKLFQGRIENLVPAKGVVEYDVNTPLFSDYSSKQRLIKMPEGTSANYEETRTLDFPIGTVIAKTFYYPIDLVDPSKGRRLIETRILKRTDEGWTGLPYVWNSDQTDAELSLTGASVEVQWLHTDGTPRSNTHAVPNMNDCKRCHLNETMEPLGPTARNLNRDMQYEHGTENQLTNWTRTGKLVHAPEPDDAPRLAVWDAPSTGTLDQRARAWLEVNCSHCHNPKGPARNSGLHLAADVTDMYHLGVFKTPVAAGKGTGGRSYGIVPGKPDESILLYRLETKDAGALMPEFGRSLVHEEAVSLIREWIESMPTIDAEQQIKVSLRL